MTPARRWTTVGAPLALLLATATALSVSFSAPLARAQDAEAPHPAHIHSGTCDNLGDIVQPLTDISEDTAGESFGATDAVAVEQSETDVPMSLSDILAAPHAVNIHESAENIQNYIACGNIGGRVIDGDLLIGLREINGSGHYGVARLETDDDGTEVYVYLSNFGAGAEPAEDAAAAPAATDETPAPTDETPAATDETPAAAEETPAAETPAAATTADEPAAAQASAETPVDIRDFAYGPNPVEIPVGGSVTWTNQDAVPHTATADQREVLQSGTISPGTSFSQVFDTAGEFNYHCEFHPNMSGTVIVK